MTGHVLTTGFETAQALKEFNASWAMFKSSPHLGVKASLAWPGSVNALQQSFEAGIGAQRIEGGLA
jgi:hypothetical protein